MCTIATFQVSFSLPKTGHDIKCHNKTYQGGATFKIYLDEYKSVQLSSRYDITGTALSASAPIAVVIGHSSRFTLPFQNFFNHQQVTNSTASLDYSEQAWSTDVWGKLYVATAFANKDLFRILGELCSIFTFL